MLFLLSSLCICQTVLFQCFFLTQKLCPDVPRSVYKLQSAPKTLFGVDEIDAQIGAILKYAARDKNNVRHLSAKYLVNQ